jgi:hypothetical protein
VVACALRPRAGEDVVAALKSIDISASLTLCW